MTSILVVDDEESIRNIVESYLKAEQFTVYTATDGVNGLASFRRYKPDFLILDIMLPGMDGLEVLQHVRRESDAYVILLTAKSEELDRVIGLTVGADDYLTKPFSPRELVARVKTILRRDRSHKTNSAPVEIYTFEHIILDTTRHIVTRDGQEIDLTPLEFDVLRVLVQHAGRVLNREQLLELVWGQNFYGEVRVVDVHIGHIRQKIEDDPSNPQFLVTVRGVGYRFEDNPL